MIRLVLALVLVFSAAATHASKLDLEPSHYEPLPSIAATDSALLPGAGWYYTAAHGGGAGDFWTGTGFLITVAGGAVLAAKLFRDNNPLLGGGVLLGVVALRFGDVHSVSRRAVALNKARLDGR